MCGPTRASLSRLDAVHISFNDGLPVLELPKSVAVNSLACKRPSVDAASLPRAHGNLWRTPDASNDKQATRGREHHASGSRTGAASPRGVSPVASPRSACSTPGGADNSMGIQLHALVFSKQQKQEQQRRSTDVQSRFGNSALSFASRSSQPSQLLSGRSHAPPLRNRTSHDLRRPSQDNGNPWASYRGSGYMLNSIAALGLNNSPTRGTTIVRGSISKAKLVLAEAINSIPGAHGLSDFSPATCDTGVLSPLLSIIRHNGHVSRRSSFSEVSSTTSSCSSTSTGCGFSCDSGLRNVPRSFARSSSSGDEELPCIPPTVNEDGAFDLDHLSHMELLVQQRQRQRAAQTQKVVDCIDTVKYLAMDDSNRMALIDLGAVELLLSKLQKAAKPEPEVSIAALGALAAICKHDVLKQQLWENPDSAVILHLVRSRRVSAVVKAAHQAAAQLAWSVDGGASTCCGASAHGSVFDSISSSHFSSADSTGSSCSGANVLLEPALIPALADALHPAADVPVLLSALRLLSKAASSVEPEMPAPPLHAASSNSHHQQQQQQRSAAGWYKVLFALMPLLIPTHRRQGHLVLNAALELLVVLTEQHPQLHNAVCISGCLPPLLAQVYQDNSEQSLQAACVLTGVVDCAAAQERLAQEPALAVLLRVLQSSDKSVDMRLAAVHMLRRLAAAVPRCVPILKAQSAVRAVVALLQEVRDSDVRHAAAGLLQLLGTPVVVRSRRSSDKRGVLSSSSINIAADGSSQRCREQQQQQAGINLVLYAQRQA